MERFRNYSHNLVFEILNEPYITKYTREAASEDKPFPFSDISQTNQNGCTREQIADLNLRTLSAIRSSGGMNQERVVVITGSMKPVVWGQQGVKMGRYIDVSHPIYATDQRIVATFHYYREDPSNIGRDFNEAKKWSESTGIPWYIGEFLHDETNDGIKSTFYETIRMEAFRHQFAIAIWDVGRAYTREEGPYSPNKFDNVMMAPLPTEATPTQQPTPASCVPNWGACDENSVCCGDVNPDRNWQCYVSSFMQTNQRTQCRHKCGTWNEGDCNLLVDMRTPYPTEDYTSYPTQVPSLKPTTPIPHPTAAPFLVPTLAPVSADPTEAPSETEENFCTLPLWRKCGGKTWVGCTRCKDSVCVYGGEYFSQCKPIAQAFQSTLN